MKCILSILSICVSLSLFGQQENIIRNPSFELEDSSFTIWKIGGCSRPCLSKSSASGEYSLSLSNPTENENHGYFYQSFHLNPRTQYKISFSYRSSCKTGRAKLSIINICSSSQGKESKSCFESYIPCHKEFDAVNGSDGWEKHSFVFHTGQAYMTYVQIELAGEIGQTYWFDDFFLRRFWWNTAENIRQTNMGEKYVFGCNHGHVIKCSSPGRIVPESFSFASGGLDANTPGDSSCLKLASPLDKRWSGGISNPHTIEFFFSLDRDASQIEVEIGYFEHKEMTRCFEVYLDDMLLGKITTPLGTYGSKCNNLNSMKFRVSRIHNVRFPQEHVIKIFQSDSWGQTIVDSIVIHGKGIKVLSPLTLSALPDLDGQEHRKRKSLGSSHIRFQKKNLRTIPLASIPSTQENLTVCSSIRNEDGFEYRMIMPQINQDEFDKLFVMDREKSVDTTGAIFETEAFDNDSSGVPRCSIAIEIEYRDDLRKPALFYSFMNYHQFSPWEMICGSPSSLDVENLGGKNDRKWKKALIVIPFTPLTRLKARNGKYCFKISTFSDPLPIKSIDVFSLTSSESRLWRKELAQRRAIKYNLHFKKFIETRQKYVPSDEEKKQGYVLQNRPDLELVFDNSTPDPDQREAPRVVLRMARGEDSISTLAFFPLMPIGEVKLKVIPPRNMRGDSIPDNCVQLKIVSPQYSTYPSFYMKKSFLDIPYHLVDCKNFHADKESRWLWILASASPRLQEGLYHGKIALETPISKKLVPLEIDILPFKLKKSPYFSLVYPGYSIDPSRYSWKQIDVFLAFLRKYGFTSSMVAWRFFNNTFFLDWKKYDESQGTYETDDLKKLVSLLRKHNLLQDRRLYLISPKPGNIINLDGKDPFEAYHKIVVAMEREFKGKNGPQLVWMPVDEPGSHNIDYAKKCVKIIQEAGGMTGGTVHRWTVEQYGSLINVRSYAPRCFANCRSVDGMMDIKLDISNKYPIGNIMAYGQNWGLRLLEERSVPWWLWKEAEIPHGFTFCYWDYLHYWADPYDNLDYMYEPEGWLRRDSGCAPSWNDDIVSTITWEEIHQGMIDLRYLTTLLYFIEKYHSLAPHAVRKAQSLISVIKNGIPARREEFTERFITKAYPYLQYDDADFHMDYRYDFLRFNKTRRKIQQAILAIQGESENAER